MVIMKRLTATLAAGATSLTFTDAAMNSNSIIEIYAVDMDVYPTNQQQTGEHSVTATFNAQMDAVNVVCLINNVMSLSQPEAASNVTYDNDESGLEAENVQAAIDELAQPEAADVSYDNTDSGLSATDVQSAIDELAQSGGGGRTVTTLWSGDQSAAGALQLSDSFLNYDEIELIWGANRTADTYLKTIRFDVLDINTTIFAQYGDNWFSNATTYCLWAGHFTDVDEFTVDNVQSSSMYAPVHVYKIRGIKY